MVRTIQQRVAAQSRVVARTPQYPLLAYFAARDRLAWLLAEQRAAEQQAAQEQRWSRSQTHTR